MKVVAPTVWKKSICPFCHEIRNLRVMLVPGGGIDVYLANPCCEATKELFNVLPTPRRNEWSWN